VNGSAFWAWPGKMELQPGNAKILDPEGKHIQQRGLGTDVKMI